MKNTKEKKQEPKLQLNGKDYNINDLGDDQKILVAHINDLNRKIDSTNFNLQQMSIGRDACINALSQALNKGQANED